MLIKCTIEIKDKNVLYFQYQLIIISIPDSCLLAIGERFQFSKLRNGLHCISSSEGFDSKFILLFINAIIFALKPSNIAQCVTTSNTSGNFARDSRQSISCFFNFVLSCFVSFIKDSITYFHLKLAGFILLVFCFILLYIHIQWH